MEAWLSYVLLLYLLFTVRLHPSRLCTKANFALLSQGKPVFSFDESLAWIVVSLKAKRAFISRFCEPTRIYDDVICIFCSEVKSAFLVPRRQPVFSFFHINVLCTYVWYVVQMYGMRVRILAQACSEQCLLHRTLEVQCLSPLRMQYTYLHSMCVCKSSLLRSFTLPVE
jgi:hypothetical protein